MEDKVKEKYTILYVDDEEDNLVVFKSAFRRDYNVITATSAAEGLEVVKNEALDLIITDQRMPHMTGIQFLKNLPEDILSIRMILTGYSDIEAVIDAINTGKVYRYITKPWNKEELKITLDKALDSLELRRVNTELLHQLKEANEGLELKVQLRTKELEEKNKDILDSITYAKRIQDSILPEHVNFKDSFADYFILYKPKAIVSGDFYWFMHKDNLTYVAVIDCTGHGVPGAFMSLLAYNFLNRIIMEKGLTEPGKILHELDNLVSLALKQNTKVSSNDGMDITLCAYDKSNSKLQLSSAMRPVLLAQQGKLTVLDPSKCAIGGIPVANKEFANHSLDVLAGDSLYMFSDGFADQFGGEQNKKIMNKTFIDIISNIEKKSMEDQKIYLDNYFQLWKGTNDQIDDVLVMGLRF